MRLELRLEPPHQQRVASFTFDEHGGYIGSDPECSWIIDCPGSRIARRHALISFDEDAFWLNDDSVDGVLHNDASSSIGRGNRVRILEGDTFRLGEIKISACRVAQTDEASSSCASDAPAHSPEPTFDAIPADWLENEANFTSVSGEEIPAQAVSRRLGGLQSSAAESLLKHLMPGATRPRVDLDVHTAGVLGKALRTALDALFSLRDELEQVEQDLVGVPPETLVRTATAEPVQSLCRRLLDETERDAATDELHALVASLSGSHRALRESAADALMEVTEFFSPTAVESRFETAWLARQEAPVRVRFTDRLVRNAGLWRFYGAWHGHLQRQGVRRADRRHFDKELLGAYRLRRKNAALEATAVLKATP